MSEPSILPPRCGGRPSRDFAVLMGIALATGLVSWALPDLRFFQALACVAGGAAMGVYAAYDVRYRAGWADCWVAWSVAARKHGASPSTVRDLRDAWREAQ